MLHIEASSSHIIPAIPELRQSVRPGMRHPGPELGLSVTLRRSSLGPVYSTAFPWVIVKRGKSEKARYWVLHAWPGD